MNSPKLRTHSDFDRTIGRELQSWAGRQHAPAEVRRRVLTEAAAQEPTRRRLFGLRSPRVVRRFRHWLSAGPTRRKPQIPYTELSQWLFNQAMWQSLGNDRRAVRFVC
jgi:hypothetical protein